MRRPVVTLGVVGLLTLSALDVPTREEILARGGHSAVESFLRLALVVLAVGAVLRLWQGASSARRTVHAWIAAVVCLLVVQELAAGATRAGWEGRTIAIALLGLGLVIVAARVPSREQA